MPSNLTDKELGVIQVVLDRYNREWLPALLEMKAKVDRGEALNDRETDILNAAIEEAEGGRSFARKHPQYQSLVDKASALYSYIKHKDPTNRS